MLLTLGVVRESAPGERRVALVPGATTVFQKTGAEIVIEAGAGEAAGFPDSEYREKGVRVASRAEVFQAAQVLLQVRTPGANVEAGAGDMAQLRRGQTVIGFAEPLTALDRAQSLARRGVNLLAMELMPRITRAQSMDALSSMATIAGYKAVLLAADSLPRMFPMLMTAAGTVAPARVLVIGAGVAGLQAIATARRLGAVVTATDVRPAAKEQVESLGAKFVAVEDEEFKAAETAAGYAKEMSPEYQAKQAALVAEHIKKQDIVVTTALIPGRPAPRLVSAEHVASMKPGSVLVDLAVEAGGNVAGAKADEIVETGGVKIVGIANLPGRIAADSSALYARNLTAFAGLLIKDGALAPDLEDEILKAALVATGGAVTHPALKTA